MAPKKKSQVRKHKRGALIIGIGLFLSLFAARAVLRMESLRGGCIVEGVVTINGHPADEAIIRVLGTRHHAEANHRGKFRIKGIRPGCVTLLIEQGSARTGYPLKLAPNTTLDMHDIPLYNWRPPGY